MSEETVNSVVYLGRYWLNDKEIVGRFALLDAIEKWKPSTFIRDTLSKHMSYFDTKKHNGFPLIVGGIYNAKSTIAEDGRLNGLTLGRTCEYLSRLDHPELVAQCEIEDRGAYAMKQRADAMKRVKADLVVMSEVSALRRMYQNQHPAHRDAFEMGLLALLRAAK